MKTQFFSERLGMGISILLIAILLSSALKSCFNFPRDDYREDLTLKEAQSLVSFLICIPGYIPSGTDPNPQIIYIADAANVPEETYIRLRYKRSDNQEGVFEVYQRYTNETNMKTSYTESAQESLEEGAKVNLLDWLSFPKLLSDAEIKSAMNRTQVEANVFQTDQTVWWLYQIVDPSEYRSTMTRWMKDQVEYRVLSYLPAEEINKITLSMLGCSNP